MKKFKDIVEKRYSVRKYITIKSVDRKLIKQCTETARLAPSAENVQPLRLLVVDDKNTLKKLKLNAFNGIYSYTKWANTAPVIIVILARPDLFADKIGAKIQDINYYALDIGIAVEHFVLQATELNLGTCWIGWFNKKGVRKSLKIPNKFKIMGLLTLGYFEYNEKINKKKRKSLDKILYFNKL